MPDEDGAGPDAHRFGVLDVLQPLGRDNGGADRPGEHGNIDDADGNHGVDQPAAQHGGDKDGQQDGGEGEENVHHTHNDAVHPALKVAGHEAQHITCGGGDADGDDTDLKGDAGTVENAAEDVPPIVVRTKPEFPVRGRFGKSHHFFRSEVGELRGKDGHQNDDEDAQHTDAAHGIAPELPYGLSKSFQGGSPQS